ncbi:hypothetical protein CF394_08780 [Tetzosporium hominis]|uniref:Uncharacterized protein n=1 Tax=Tetzosporium hominis TaxID=2020506 RepID=A0A264W2P5_9BACL|nr:hypothetical protein [Tetzosporium hominis]OZS77839.1 hypothetical protein CF394_08780 [Tetzosporium hominis]
MNKSSDRRLMLMFFHYLVSIAALIFIFIYKERLQEVGTLWIYILVTLLLLALAIFETYRYRKGKSS